MRVLHVEFFKWEVVKQKTFHKKQSFVLRLCRPALAATWNTER